MAIYSDNEAEVEDRLASYLAGAGTTSSLAASAAAALKADPQHPISPRLRAALEAMVRLMEAVMEIDLSPPAEGGDRVPFPEELVAKLAQPSSTGDEAATAAEKVQALVTDLKLLLESPSADVAGRVESFLAALSRMENAQAQQLARGSLDLELLASSPTSH
jgi:hypothetical protein